MRKPGSRYGPMVIGSFIRHLGQSGDVFGSAEVSFSRCGSKLLMALDSCDVKVVDASSGQVICRILDLPSDFDVQWYPLVMSK